MRPPSSENAPQRTMGAVVIATVVTLLVAAALIAWGLWRHNRAIIREDGGSWWSQSTANSHDEVPRRSPIDHPAPSLPASNGNEVPGPITAAAPGLPGQPLSSSSTPLHQAEGRSLLRRPSPSQGKETAAAREHRRRHHRWEYLGLDRVWHWIRHERPKPQD